jgi:hypothetical protein
LASNADEKEIKQATKGREEAAGAIGEQDSISAIVDVAGETSQDSRCIIACRQPQVKVDLTSQPFAPSTPTHVLREFPQTFFTLFLL